MAQGLELAHLLPRLGLGRRRQVLALIVSLAEAEAPRQVA